MDDLETRGHALREQHPDWSTRMILDALLHGEDSPEFREAERRARDFPTVFEATDGWMGLT